MALFKWRGSVIAIPLAKVALVATVVLFLRSLLGSN
jgi:hypothetical protein